MRTILFCMLFWCGAFAASSQTDYCDYFKLAVEITEVDGKLSPSIWIEQQEVEDDTLSKFIQQHQGRFDYILYNRIDFRKLADLSPDTAAMKASFCEQVSSAEIRDYFVMLSNQNITQLVFSQAEMMKIASRFFLCDKVNEENLNIGYHICIGINGQKELKSERDYTVLEAFCYEAIFHYLAKGTPAFQRNFESYISKSSARYKTENLAPADFLEKVKQDCYTAMEQDAALEKSLLRFYKKNQGNIGIVIN